MLRWKPRRYRQSRWAEKTLEDERKAGTCHALTAVQAFAQITWLDATNQTENRQYVHYVDKETDVSSLPTAPQLLCTYVSMRLGQSGTIASAFPTNLSWKLKVTVHTCSFHGFPKSTFHSHWLYLSPFHCFKPVIYKGNCRGVYLLASLLQQSARHYPKLLKKRLCLLEDTEKTLAWSPAAIY